MSLFEIDGVRKSFGGIQALDGASLDVADGELVGLIGPNGAGKTTLFDCVSGIVPPDAGTVTFAGTEVTDHSPHERARAGLVRTFQTTRELTTMTVRENVRLPALDHPGEKLVPAVTRSGGVADREAAVADRADELIEFFELDHLADEYAGNLSGGQRKLLEVARALMLEPDLLLLDEPLAGVNPALGQRITEYVARLNDDGMAFLVIEHEIDTLADLVERLVVLDQGSVLVEGPPDEVLADERVIDAYLGGPGE